MVSGPKADFELLKGALDVIGKVFFIGEKPGSAETMKLANNSCRQPPWSRRRKPW